MDCEECDWTGMEKERDLWRDGSEIRVINICYSAGRLTDDIITSAVSLELDISTFQKYKCHYNSNSRNCMFTQSTLLMPFLMLFFIIIFLLLILILQTVCAPVHIKMQEIIHHDKFINVMVI